ncbi:hypothetical protein MCOR25_007189 [Pyricularia grisea]|uniref:Uncharacterized protein n=1 Tax=Pyricularia grisea TaxID=148305 RepID=A0A6P8B419_PYRGI|nr:hypothetical protein PgNI_05556 [Pyricularia grisea]KAI6358996.1 hypothetical protein MCOR25_007189 [Pyricularia grisea]TLD10081.1 hypothetical protein PgNI_05556 [Pyricularia grisea]
MEPHQEPPTQEDTYDAAEIMAQTMGFSSFGAAARPSKRRRTDDAVVASPQNPVRVSSANSTSLGIRLPQRVGDAHRTPASAQTSVAASNADEIDLDLEEEGFKAYGAADDAASAAPVEGAAPGPEASGPASAHVPVDGPHGPPGRAQGQPWYVDYYDRKSNQNPWKKLEEKLGLEPRGSWPPP